MPTGPGCRQRHDSLTTGADDVRCAVSWRAPRTPRGWVLVSKPGSLLDSADAPGRPSGGPGAPGDARSAPSPPKIGVGRGGLSARSSYGGSDSRRRHTNGRPPELPCLAFPSFCPQPPSAADTSTSPLGRRLVLGAAPGRIRFVILRTDGSPPVAPHLLSRGRSYLRLQAEVLARCGLPPHRPDRLLGARPRASRPARRPPRRSRRVWRRAVLAA